MVLRRPLLPAVLALVLALAVVGCGDDDGDEGDGGTITTSVTTTAPADTDTDTGSTSPSTDDPGTATTDEAPGTATTVPAFDGDEEAKSAEPDGTGTAQLVAARVGQQPVATRFVLEFDGEVRPGYEVRWVDGPITEDGSGDPVDLEGEAFLQVLVQPATGFDLDAGVPTYDGPTRLAGPTGGAVTEAVRTGDFEALLTWVLGAEERVPFTVSTLGSPSRLVIDLQDG
ncbi:MAG TPA: hypothetical protein VEW93_14460 [Acidimicrobiales bacterium]|nr:hypothetical protein [Acidimicrobiales bacterium]